MNKKTILYALLDLIFLAIFNLIFFVAGGVDHPASVWISYAFIHFAYLTIIVTPLLIRKSSSAAVFGFSLYSISATYFVVEFVVGLIFILIGGKSYAPALCVQALLLAIYALILIPNLLANEYTADSVEKHEAEVAYIKDAASRVKLLIDKASDRKANKKIEAVYDLLYSSPTKSHSSVRVMELEIMDGISVLEDAVGKDDAEMIFKAANNVISTAEKRNSILKVQ